MNQTLIDRIEDTLYSWKRRYHIFDGGCCFVAAVIAKNLEDIGEDFKVITYQLKECENLNVSELCESCNLMHLGIEVMDDNGDGHEFGCDFVDGINEAGVIRKVYDGKYDSNDLFSIYESYEWNERYPTILNNLFKNEIERLFDNGN